jgi:hypothetical protein
MTFFSFYRSVFISRQAGITEREKKRKRKIISSFISA